MTTIVDERPAEEPTVTIPPLPSFSAVLMLERADIERRYFTGKLAALQLIRGPHEIPDEEVEAEAKADAWSQAAKALREALYGDPALADGDHFRYAEKREPGLHSLRVVGERLEPPPHAPHLHYGQTVPSAPPFIAGCDACDWAYRERYAEAVPRGARR